MDLKSKKRIKSLVQYTSNHGKSDYAHIYAFNYYFLKVKFSALSSLGFQKLIALILLISLVTISCINDKSPGPLGIDTTIPNLTHLGIWITNEGGFTFGQASLSFLDLVEDSMYNNVFLSINGRPLGDVLQSLSFHRGRGYLVLNNSQKIEVVDSITFKSIATINDLYAPVEVVGYQNNLFVSDLYSNKLTVIDASTLVVKTYIETGGWTNKMLLYDNRLFVTVQQISVKNLPGSKKGLLIIDALTFEELSFIPLAQGANSLQIDKNNKIWVLCDGGLEVEEEIGGIYKIDPNENTIENYIAFPSSKYSANNLMINRAKDQLYFIISDPNEGLNAYNITSFNIDETIFSFNNWFDGEQLYIYGYLIDEVRNEFYFNDAVGLIQEGFCYRYNLSNQTFIEKYKTGIFPSQLYLSK